MIPIGDIISNGLSAVAEFFGWRREKASRENTEEMQQNAKGAQDAAAADQGRKDATGGDLDKVRRDLS